MISLDEATRIVIDDMAHGPAHHRDGVRRGEPSETPSGWYFPITYIGSVGRMVNKADGSVYVFGSQPGVEIWLWGYEQGFRFETSDLIVAKVTDIEATTDLLSRSLNHPGVNYFPNRSPPPGWLRNRLRSLPARFCNQNHLRFMKDFYLLRSGLPFEFHVAPDSHFAWPNAQRAWIDRTAFIAASSEETLTQEVRNLADEGRAELLMRPSERIECLKPPMERRLQLFRTPRSGDPAQADAKVEYRRVRLLLRRLQAFPVHLVDAKPEQGERVITDIEDLRAWLREIERRSRSM